MIKPLRKRHLQIWSLWAVLLPAVIVSAVLVRKPDAVSALPELKIGRSVNDTPHITTTPTPKRQTANRHER